MLYFYLVLLPAVQNITIQWITLDCILIMWNPPLDLSLSATSQPLVYDVTVLDGKTFLTQESSLPGTSYKFILGNSNPKDHLCFIVSGRYQVTGVGSGQPSIPKCTSFSEMTCKWVSNNMSDAHVITYSRMVGLD